jgi:hypothetical protein
MAPLQRRDSAMDSVTPEDAIKIAAIRRKTHVCVLDAQQQMRGCLTSS